MKICEIVSVCLNVFVVEKLIINDTNIQKRVENDEMEMVHDAYVHLYCIYMEHWNGDTRNNCK